MKITYNGTELDTIIEGYWPEGVTLVLHDGNITSREVRDAVCLRSGSVLRANGATMTGWRFWAILPTKPAPRRLTNREVGELCKKRWDVLTCNGFIWYGYVPAIEREHENDSCGTATISKLRAPNSDEWLEPTSDLLEHK